MIKANKYNLKTANARRYAVFFMDLILKFKDAVKRHSLLDKGDAVLLCVSGGVDSSVMLHAFNSIKKEYSLKLAVFHLNHNLRGRESLRDFEFVKKEAKRLRLAFFGYTLKKGELKGMEGSAQEAARGRRYQLIEEAMKRFGATKAALGHTLDDQAETVLMRLLKGSSLKGLSGIPVKRGPFVRPLIEIGREEIDEFAKAKDIRFVVDSSNLTAKYLRNDIRLNLIPYLRDRFNPNIVETIGRAALALRQDDLFIEKEADRAYPSMVVKKSVDTVTLNCNRLLSVDRAIAARVFMRAVRELRPEVELASAHIEAFGALLEGGPSASIQLPEGVRAARKYDEVSITTLALEEAEPFDKPLTVPGLTMISDELTIKTSVIKKAPKILNDADIAFFDYNALSGAELRVRSFIPGDRITPFGMKSAKKLKEVFIDSRVPRQDRVKVPIITVDGLVIWAAGVKRSALFPVSATTKAILKIELVRLEK